MHQQLQHLTIPTLTLPGYRNHSQPQHFKHSHSHKRSHHIQKDAADRLNNTLGGFFFVYTSTPKHTCLSDVPLCRRTCALRRLGQQPAHCRAQLDEAYLRVSFHAHLPRTYSLSAQYTIKREHLRLKPLSSHFFFWQRLDEIFVGCDGTHDVPAMDVHGTLKPACRQACRQACQLQRVASTSERSSDSAAVCLYCF